MLYHIQDVLPNEARLVHVTEDSNVGRITSRIDAVLGRTSARQHAPLIEELASALLYGTDHTELAEQLGLTITQLQDPSEEHGPKSYSHIPLDGDNVIMWRFERLLVTTTIEHAAPNGKWWQIFSPRPKGLREERLEPRVYWSAHRGRILDGGIPWSDQCVGQGIATTHEDATACALEVVQDYAGAWTSAWGDDV